MARVPFAERSNMTSEGQAVWDDIENSRGGVARNYAALLNNPEADNLEISAYPLRQRVYQILVFQIWYNLNIKRTI